MKSFVGRVFKFSSPLAACLLLLASADRLFPRSSYFTAWSTRYQGSATENGSCQICHGGTTSTLNGYGRAIQLQLSAGIDAALVNVQNLNSDSDPGAFSNLAEINAGAQPGWTAGNNTVYDTGNAATSTQSPPFGATVKLDPTAPPPATPDINVTALTIEFGAVTAGSSQTGAVTVQNLGNADLTVSNLAITGSVFTLDPATPARPFTVPPGGSASVVVRFSPAAAGDASGSLTIASNDADEASVAVTLHGTGTAPATFCDINVTPLALNFGSVPMGQPAALAVSIGNTGTAPCTVSTLSLSKAEFALKSPPALPFTVSPGSSVSAQIEYAPANLGADSANLQVGSNDPDEASVTVSLAGTGVAALVCDLSVSQSLAFGGVTVGTTASLSAELRNNGTAACAISALTVTGAGFSLGSAAPALPAQIAAGETLSVPVGYSPASVGPSSGSLTVASNDPDTPAATIALTGSGQQAAACDLTVNPSSVAFGSVTQGTTSTRTVTVSNAGSANCTVNSLSVTGTDLALGAAAPDVPATLIPGGSLAVPVAYAPTGAGPDSGTLAIASTDPNEAVISVGLSGTGALAPVCNIQVSPLSLSFGGVPLGSTVTRSTTITNTGTAECTLGSPSTSGTSEFSLGAAAALPPTLGPGAAATLSLVYTPADLGDDAGTLTINSGDPDQPSISVSLTGSGVPVSQQCDVQVDPLSLNFGDVAVGSNVVLSTTVKNAGTGSCDVGPQMAEGSSADFALVQSAAVVIPPGESAAISVRYTPSGSGGDSGSLRISSNDASEALIPVALAGTGFVRSGTVDLAIVDFSVPREFRLSRFGSSGANKPDDDGDHRVAYSDDDDDDHSRRRAISVSLVVESRGSINQPREATVTGVQNGTEVYRQSVMVSAPVGRRRSFELPSYVPVAVGEIQWTVVIADDVPANSTASAVTQVRVGREGGDTGSRERE